MNYLGRVNRHIVSSHHMNRDPKSSSFLGIIALLLAMVILFFIGRTYIGNILFGIRGLFIPNAHSNITLHAGAFESELATAQSENKELKKLLMNSGVRIPNHDINTLGDEINIAHNTSSGDDSDLGTTTGTGTSTASTTIPTFTAKSTDEKGEKESPYRTLMLKSGDVISTVIMRPPQTPYDAFIIESGIDEGIEIGDQVYAWEGFPLGEIIDVSKNRATVRLFSAPGNKMEVFIGTSTFAVIAEGKGGGNFFLKLPKVSDIKNGDLVARRFLPPEVFSSIESVDSNAGEAYTYAYFKLPISLNNIVYVLIKKNPNR